MSRVQSPVCRVRVSWRRSGEASGRIDIGRDGLAMLALSSLTIAATGGITYLLALLFVLRGAAASADLPPRGARIVVLGVRLRATGAPTAEYLQRLDRAADVLTVCLGSGITVLGGITRRDLRSEAETGADYLVRDRNVLPSRIACERRSRHTLENLRFYRAEHQGTGTGIALVTSRFHMARACLLARGLGLRVHPVPADGGAVGVLRLLARMPFEAFLIHWYCVGRGFARLTRDARMAARIL